MEVRTAGGGRSRLPHPSRLAQLVSYGTQGPHDDPRTVGPPRIGHWFRKCTADLPAGFFDGGSFSVEVPLSKVSLACIVALKLASTAMVYLINTSDYRIGMWLPGPYRLVTVLTSKQASSTDLSQCEQGSVFSEVIIISCSIFCFSLHLIPSLYD